MEFVAPVVQTPDDICCVSFLDDLRSCIAEHKRVGLRERKTDVVA